MRSKRSPVPVSHPAVAPSRLLTPVEAAERCGVGKTKLLELVRSRRLSCRMLDGRIRIAESDLAAFIDGLPAGYEKQKIPANLRRASA
jgi:excisionase family DNA binding protein